MKALFWVLCGLILWSYAAYPLVLAVLSSLLRRERRADPSHTPAITILIPAYNEERVIAAKLANTLGLDYPRERLEILVASESDDRTDAIVGPIAAGADVPVTLLTSPVRRGKVANLFHAVPHARGEVLVFTDANAMLRRDALRKLARNFADPRVGSVSGRLVYREAGGAASAEAERTYWDFEMLLKGASSAMGSLPGSNGSLFAVRRELYRPISETRGDDFELPIRVILDGHESILEPEAVTIESAAADYGQEFRRKVRIINWMSVSALILLGEAIRARRWLLVVQLVSHKLNRWAAAFWLLALAPVSAALAPLGGVYLGAAAAQGLLYGLALAGLIADRMGMPLPRALGLPLYFVVVNAASMAGILTRLAGRDVAWHKRADRVA